MTNYKSRQRLLLMVIAVLLQVPFATFASEDKTATNPINFSSDFRVYNEYSQLNTDGDGSQNLLTAELRLPLADGKWQWRLRARHNSIQADIDDDGSDDLEWGWMMTNWYQEMKDRSFYLRPSVGVGADRPTEGPIEFGHKMVGW